jgi:hypothetical protein
LRGVRGPEMALAHGDIAPSFYLMPNAKSTVHPFPGPF